MKKLALVMALLMFAATGLSACETTKGAGRDIQNAGQAMDDAV